MTQIETMQAAVAWVLLFGLLYVLGMCLEYFID